tara:strand:+ start:452 stop:871 length:420 start_codon:yes stop_codon:yes gene_type:complete
MKLLISIFFIIIFHSYGLKAEELILICEIETRHDIVKGKEITFYDKFTLNESRRVEKEKETYLEFRFKGLLAPGCDNFLGTMQENELVLGCVDRGFENAFYSLIIDRYNGKFNFIVKKEDEIVGRFAYRGLCVKGVKLF